MYVVCVYERVDLVWPHLESAAAGWTRGAFDLNCLTNDVCCGEAQIKLTQGSF